MSRAHDPARMIDWAFAVKVGSTMAGDGPVVSAAEAADCVAQLREDAQRSSPLVREFTGLHAAERTAPVLVVDRAGWIQANADAFAQIMQPVVTKLFDRKGSPGKLTQAVGSRVAGAEVGALLGFMGNKVLGQFDPFHEAPGEHGRLLLVAPNIVHVERELGVDSDDFRLWVCLHEETHRVQFTAVEWMRDYLSGELAAFIDAVPSDPTQMVTDLFGRIADIITGKSQGSLLDLVGSPEQKAVLDRMTGVMSLLEGHADVVMDGVGPEVIPTVAEIRTRFTKRRKGVGGLDRVLRRLLGLDQKMAQYRDGAVFVRQTVEAVGMEGFNAVWTGPDQLPSKAEVLDPPQWLKRVHG
ncbi:MAG: zinc-dependent metalloprotease [Marmoricola sp.]